MYKYISGLSCLEIGLACGNYRPTLEILWVWFQTTTVKQHVIIMLVEGPASICEKCRPFEAQ